VGLPMATCCLSLVSNKQLSERVSISRWEPVLSAPPSDRNLTGKAKGPSPRLRSEPCARVLRARPTVMLPCSLALSVSILPFRSVSKSMCLLAWTNVCKRRGECCIWGYCCYVSVCVCVLRVNAKETHQKYKRATIEWRRQHPDDVNVTDVISI